MSVIPAASVRFTTLVDGTLRLTCDIEPRDAQAAFALFASPGTPIALAALKATKLSSKTGPYCMRAVMLCQEPQFWEWLKFASMSGADPQSAEEAATIMRRVCKIESRTELDTDDEALDRFNTKIAAPYAKWLRKTVVA